MVPSSSCLAQGNERRRADEVEKSCRFDVAGEERRMCLRVEIGTDRICRRSAISCTCHLPLPHCHTPLSLSPLRLYFAAATPQLCHKLRRAEQ